MTRHELEKYRTAHHQDQEVAGEEANAVACVAPVSAIRATLPASQPEVAGVVKGVASVGREQSVGVGL